MIWETETTGKSIYETETRLMLKQYVRPIATYQQLTNRENEEDEHARVWVVRSRFSLGFRGVLSKEWRRAKVERNGNFMSFLVSVECR